MESRVYELNVKKHLIHVSKVLKFKSLRIEPLTETYQPTLIHIIDSVSTDGSASKIKQYNMSIDNDVHHNGYLSIRHFHTYFH